MNCGFLGTWARSTRQSESRTWTQAAGVRGDKTGSFAHSKVDIGRYNNFSNHHAPLAGLIKRDSEKSAYRKEWRTDERSHSDIHGEENVNSQFCIPLNQRDRLIWDRKKLLFRKFDIFRIKTCFWLSFKPLPIRIINSSLNLKPIERSRRGNSNDFMRRCLKHSNDTKKHGKNLKKHRRRLLRGDDYADFMA